MLNQDHVTISEVAYDIGFSEPDYFGRIFKKEFGMTTSQYQDNHKNAI